MPRLLCLHGMGTNSEIFELQLAALHYELGPQYDFDFVEASVPWPPHPQIKEFFSPSPVVPECFTYFDPSSVESLRAAINDLDEYIRSYGQFDGLIGFSQGASLAVSYLFWKKTQNFNHICPAFKCMVLFCPAGAADCSGKGRILNSKEDGTVVDVPAAVIYGGKDEDAAISLEIIKMCKNDICEVLSHDGGHEVPRGSQITKDMARAITTTISRALHYQ